MHTFHRKWRSEQLTLTQIIKVKKTNVQSGMDAQSSPYKNRQGLRENICSWNDLFICILTINTTTNTITQLLCSQDSNQYNLIFAGYFGPTWGVYQVQDGNNTTLHSQVLLQVFVHVHKCIWTEDWSGHGHPAHCSSDAYVNVNFYTIFACATYTFKTTDYHITNTPATVVPGHLLYYSVK